MQTNRVVLFSVLLSGVGAFTVACAGSGTSGADAAGGRGQAGSSSASGGAGGGVPALGNLTLIIQPSTSGNCPTAGKAYIVGDPQGPNSTTPGDSLTDGENGASIKCSVRGSGPYTFSGNIKGKTTENELVTVELTNGVVNADQLTGTATIALNTSQLAGTFSSTQGSCSVNVVAGNVKPGSLWATISCPSITDPSTPGSACSVGPSTTFVLENCDGS